MLYLNVLIIVKLIASLLGHRMIKEVDFYGSYYGTMADTCEDGEYRIQAIPSVPLYDCVIECALREHCDVLNYRQPFQLCELYQQAENPTTITGNCFRVAKEDIRTTKVIEIMHSFMHRLINVLQHKIHANPLLIVKH